MCNIEVVMYLLKVTSTDVGLVLVEMKTEAARGRRKVRRKKAEKERTMERREE
jgi:hypothetical protein